jgi:tripeptidyl-peptidase I
VWLSQNFQPALEREAVTMLRIVVTGLLLIRLAFSHPASDGYAIHEKRDVLPEGWSKLSPADPAANLHLQIGLTQNNLELGDSLLSEISDPSSPSYGRILTPQQVIETFAPSKEAVSETFQWLIKAGITREHFQLRPSLGWIHVQTAVSQAEKLLNTKFYLYEHADGSQQIACESYSIPQSLQPHIDLIAPTVHLESKGTARHAKRDGISPKVNKIIKPPSSGESLQNCSQETTPACLRAL